jgi:hypothetical protein
VIDTASERLQNVITFPPDGSFVVDSSLVVTGPQRCEFKFRAASLNRPHDESWKVPPFGKGWFDTVYVDNKIRIARDIRGDTLIVAREGPPRWFKV